MSTHNLPAVQREIAPEPSTGLVIEAVRGIAYFRRHAWAAFNYVGECVGTFETAREACAALGGAK